MFRTHSLVLFLALAAGIAVSCRQSAQQYIAKGNSFFEAGKYADAAINYKKAIQRDSKSGEGYYRLGLVALRTNDSHKAYDALSNAVRLMPDRTDVKVLFADFLLLGYIESKNRPAVFYTRLTKLTDELLAKDPNSYDGLRLKGAIAWTDKKPKEAEEFLQKANARKPMQPDLVVMWVQILFRDGQPAEAERLARELIQAHKEAGAIYDALYAQYRLQNRPADAENILRAKANNNPGNSDYALELATFYAGAGKRDQMTATLQRLLDDPKTFPDGRLKVGDFYGALHDWPEALKLYQEGADRDPKQKITYLKRISDSWLAQGKGDQAAGVVGEILKQEPKDDIAKAVNDSLLVKTGRPEKVQAAVNDLQELVKKQPEDVLFKLALGQALLAQGHQDEAAAQFLESLQKRPNYLPSIMAMAELSLAKRDYVQTLGYATKALSLNPRLTEARLLRTVSLLGSQKYSEARADLTALESEFPQNIEVQFQLATLDMAEKKYPRAEERFEKLYGKDKYRSLGGVAESYREQGQIDKALSRLTQEVGKAPTVAAIRLLLADTALRASKYELALDQYRQLLLMEPRSVLVQARIGTAYQLKGDFPKAIAILERLKEQAPRDPAVAAALGDALAMAGRNADAEASYRQMLALDPGNPNAMNNLAYALLNSGAAPEEAQKLAEAALRKSPRNPDFEDTLGLAYLKKNLPDRAVQVYSSLIQRFPDDPVFRYHYGLSLTQNGQNSQAKIELEAALRRSPPDALRKDIQSSLAKMR